MSDPKIIKIAPAPYNNLVRRIELLLASHPEVDDFPMTCFRIALLVFEIESRQPDYAEALESELRRYVHEIERM